MCILKVHFFFLLIFFGLVQQCQWNDPKGACSIKNHLQDDLSVAHVLG